MTRTLATIERPARRGMLGRRHSAFVAAVAMAVVLVLAACGQTPSITLSIDAATAELLRGSEVQVEVNLTRAGGATTDVALTVTGLPANVDASFAPATLSGGTVTSTLTLSGDAAAVEGVYDLEVVGAGPGLTASAPLSLEVVSLTVKGRVISTFDFALPGAVVGSQGDTDVTDLNGEFTLTGLSVPYDVSVWSTTEDWLHVFEGYTSDQLVLAPIISLLGGPAKTKSAMVTGTLSGGVIPVAADQEVRVCLEDMDGGLLWCDTVDPTESSYSISASWYGPATRQVRVHALQIATTLGVPSGYPGYASLDVTLTDTVPVVANLDLGTALSTTTVAVEIDADSAIGGRMAAVQLGPNLAIPVMMAFAPETSYEVLMPVLTDSTSTLIAFSDAQNFGWTAEATGSEVTVVVPGPTIQIAPADAATNVTTDTVFTAVNPADGPFTYLWRFASGPAIGLTTMKSSVSILDPTEYGLAIPTAGSGTWQLLGHSGATAEAAASGINDLFNSVYMMAYGISSGLHGTGSVSLSETWDFTTAP